MPEMLVPVEFHLPDRTELHYATRRPSPGDILRTTDGAFIVSGVVRDGYGYKALVTPPVSKRPRWIPIALFALAFGMTVAGIVGAIAVS